MSVTAQYEDIQLVQDPDHRSAPLSIMCQEFIEKLITEFEHYSNLEDLLDMDTFLPETIPTDEFAVIAYTSIAPACKLALKFNLLVEETMQKWSQALTKIVRSGDFERP